MNKLLLAVSLFTFGLAHAQSGKSDKPATPPSGGTATAAGNAPPTMEMPKPGPEQDALKPFIHSSPYTGTHMMPDGKELPTKGKQTCKWLPGNMWAACDIEMTTGTGKTAMKWNGHLVMGYDTMAKGYRAVMTDNMGMLARMKGTLEGSKMVWESMDEVKMPGMPSKERVTEDATDPKNSKMTFEGMMNGKWTPMGGGSFKGGGK
jgi:hypothetical protein